MSGLAEEYRREREKILADSVPWELKMRRLKALHDEHRRSVEREERERGG